MRVGTSYILIIFLETRESYPGHTKRRNAHSSSYATNILASRSINSAIFKDSTDYVVIGNIVYIDFMEKV
jgi:hypothetical protein